MLDSVLNVEKPLRDQTATLMQFWLEFINMPSRQDVVRLATQLNDANARLDDLQELVESLQDQLKVGARNGRGAVAVTGGGA